ncbi:hypothetical protein C943_03002 [Mariniradius saccharolyticus AK6]|uniref:Uncharacterized protein n=1 Tax=Mariniradius saccharolyticus AK6 TaxID=1239962 RepID=M7XJU1_9BACT|nr:hypothetical protein C943_03002 [Mariniradius saccharolyticus AK6]
MMVGKLTTSINWKGVSGAYSFFTLQKSETWKYLKYQI